MATVVTATVLPDGPPRESGYTHGLIALLLVMLLAAAVALLIPRVESAVIDRHLIGELEHAQLDIVAAGTLVGDRSEQPREVTSLRPGRRT